MHPLRILLVLGAALLLGSTSVRAQEGPLQKLFSGEKAAKASAGNPGKSRATKLSLFGGEKRVEIDLTAQRLRAYEGGLLVMQTRISSGRNRATPTGRFTAGPYKSEKHYSSLYQNAPMPWSVQVHGHIFIHGFSSVPDYPASHGCIRVPITGNNPAKRFYNWVEVGTPIHIFY